jgi:N-dimethylarginine dimethylaminohydrolase
MEHMSEVGRITHIVLRHPEQAFVSQEKVDAQWRELNYTDRPSYDKAITEYDQLVALFQKFGMKIDFLPADTTLTLDSLYVRDATVVTHRGVILCNMGKDQRVYEPAVARTAFAPLGVPVVGAICEPGHLEGGDVIWLDTNTLAVGRTYRTNAEGISQLQALVGPEVDVVPVPLPHYRGPSDVFHLMSIVSPIDYDLALVYSPLMPIPFRELLIDRGIQLVEVAAREFETMGCNVLAVAPRQCVMLKGNPKTRALLEDAGATVWEITGQEISVKGQGGPTCLTRPLVRE